MSVAPQMKQNSLEDERRAHEPSMEEILASIRRIIADDENLPSRRQGVASAVELDARRPLADHADSTPAESDDPGGGAMGALEPVSLRRLEEGRHQGADLAVFPGRDESAPDLAAPFSEPLAPRSPTETAGAPSPQPYPEAAAAEVDDAAYAFVGDEAADAPEAGPGLAEPASPLVSPEAAASVASHFEALAASIFIKDSGLLQEYAKELLRPMLKQWLDDNLPVMVERLVRAEIERVARGRR